MNHKEEFKRIHRRGPARILGILVRVLMGIGIAALFAFAFAILVKVLWNWIMPPLFGLSMIGFWQAFGLLLLAKIFFGGHGHGDHHRVPKDSHRHFHDWLNHHATDPGMLQREACIGGSESGTRDHFNAFWEAEGRRAFETFLQRRRSESKQSSPPEDQ